MKFILPAASFIVLASAIAIPRVPSLSAREKADTNTFNFFHPRGRGVEERSTPTITKRTPAQVEFAPDETPAPVIVPFDENAEPVKRKPAKPVVEEPAEPEEEEPANPDAEEPAEPGKKEPANPDAEEPAEPGKKEPANPDAEEPARPGKKEPANPDAEEPARPGKKEPANPDAEEPARPGKKEPANPDAEEPARPGKKEPANRDGEDQEARSEEPSTPLKKRASQSMGFGTPAVENPNKDFNPLANLV